MTRTCWNCNGLREEMTAYPSLTQWERCRTCEGTGVITEPDPEPPAPVSAPAVKVVLTITMANGTTRTRRPNVAQAPARLQEWIERTDVAFVAWKVEAEGQGSWTGGVRGAGYAQRVPIRIDRDARTGRHVAHSTTVPGRLYAIDGQKCSCAGFARHGRCKHLASFIEREERLAA
jgi:hypothetical protein